MYSTCCSSFARLPPGGVRSVCASNVTTVVLFAVQMPKHRKLVDRRASKGRKIRFNTMDKLVNFMEPVHVYEDDANGRISSLYGNLFGHAAWQQ